MLLTTTFLQGLFSSTRICIQVTNQSLQFSTISYFIVLRINFGHALNYPTSL